MCRADRPTPSDPARARAAPGVLLKETLPEASLTLHARASCGIRTTICRFDLVSPTRAGAAPRECNRIGFACMSHPSHARELHQGRTLWQRCHRVGLTLHTRASCTRDQAGRDGYLVALTALSVARGNTTRAKPCILAFWHPSRPSPTAPPQAGIDHSRRRAAPDGRTAGTIADFAKYLFSEIGHSESIILFV